MIEQKGYGERDARRFLDESGVYQMVLPSMLEMAERLMLIDDLPSDQCERLSIGLLASMMRSGTVFHARAAALLVSQALASGRMDGDQFRSLGEIAPLLIDAMFDATTDDAETFQRHGRAGRYASTVVWAALEALAERRW